MRWRDIAGFLRFTSLPHHAYSDLERNRYRLQRRVHAKHVRSDVGRLSAQRVANLRRVWKRALRLMTTLRAHATPDGLEFEV